MSANINTIAYYGETPWHKLGTKVDNVMTSTEAIEAAKLNWKVEKKGIFFFDGSKLQNVPNKHTTVRTDTNVPLGVVGERYTVLQNSDAFKFFDSIVGEKLACFHTVGALGQGEKIWLLAKLPGEFWVTPEDVVEKYLLLTNSHNGTSAVQIMATPIRVVCQNTLNMAISGSAVKSSVRHTYSMGLGVNQIRTEVGLANRHFQLFETLSKQLVSKQANTEIVETLLSDLGLSKEKAKDSTRTENIRCDILRKFENGKGNNIPSVRGSVWALLNGVVEWVDYTRSTRKGDGESSNESRTDSLLFGSGANLKQKAMDSLLVSTR